MPESVYMCVVGLRKTKEKGTDWYSEDKDASGEVTVIFEGNSSRDLFKQENNTVKKRTGRQTN